MHRSELTDHVSLHLGLQLSRDKAEEFYKEHAEKEFFPTLVNFMTSGPIWALVLAKPGAIPAWRELMGPTNSLNAKEEAPARCVALHALSSMNSRTEISVLLLHQTSNQMSGTFREVDVGLPSFCHLNPCDFGLLT